jgi:hypothetical protein
MRGSRNIIISVILALGAAGSIMADTAIATQAASASVVVAAPAASPATWYHA